MPIRHFESNEPSVVVTVAEAGVHSDAGGQLTAATDFRSSRAVKRSIQHGAGEVKPAIVQIAPQVPNVLLDEILRCRLLLLS